VNAYHYLGYCGGPEACAYCAAIEEEAERLDKERQALDRAISQKIEDDIREVVDGATFEEEQPTTPNNEEGS